MIEPMDIFNSNQEYSMDFNIWDCIPFIKNRRRRLYNRRTSISSDGSGGVNSIDLELHIAVSCGDITNIILGDMNDEDDPIINKDTTKGSSSRPLSSIHNYDIDLPSPSNNRLSMISSNSGNDPSEQQSLPYNGRLEYAICGPAVEALDAVISLAKAGEMCITPDAFDLIKRHYSIPFSYEKRKQFYIIRETATNHTASLNGSTLSEKPTKRPHHYYYNPVYGTIKHPLPGNIIQSNNYLVESSRSRQSSYANPSTTIRQTTPIIFDFDKDRDDGDNPAYLKYINQSALFRLQQGVDNSFSAQFRDVTIMFISLGKLNPATKEGLQKAQEAVRLCIKVLLKYEGRI